MTICFPTLDDAGLAATLSEHFGRSPYFTLIDDLREDVETLANPGARHGSGSCSAAELLRGRAIEAVVCRHLGHGALARLEAMRVPVFVSSSVDVANAFEEYRQGRARPAESALACDGHSHGHR